MAASPCPPLAVTDDDGVGLTTPEPYVRHVKVLLSPLLQEGLGDFSVGSCEVPPGQAGSLHTHPGTVEVWMFYEGEGRAVVGGREFTTGPGSVVYTPPGAAHQFFNTGDTPARLFWLYSPAGAERNVIESEFV